MEVCGWCGALALGGECTNCIVSQRGKMERKRKLSGSKEKTTKPKSGKN